MKIYTKTGDTGETGLIGGTRVSKADLRIDAYGTVDELNSWIGLIRTGEVDQRQQAILAHIQDRLFVIGSHLAADPIKSRMQLPDLMDADVQLLEAEMDHMNLDLPELRAFVLPGGNQQAAYGHLARTVCRRAERLVVDLHQHAAIEMVLIEYLNRLSDYLFTLSRKFCLDAGDEEIKWLPRG
jgi:cob(I)alamin adenosyltransferase